MIKTIKALNAFFREKMSNATIRQKIKGLYNWINIFIEEEEYELAEYYKNQRNDLISLYKQRRRENKSTRHVLKLYYRAIRRKLFR